MAFYKCDKKQNGGSLKIGDVSNLAAEVQTEEDKVVLTWEDPDDLVIGGVVQAKWAGTIIVKKAFGEPTSIGDGTVIVNNTVKNQYSENGFEDTDIIDDVECYYKAFPYTTDGVTTDGSFVVAHINRTDVYGVEWDGTASSAWTRTDAAAEFEDPNPYYSGKIGANYSPFDDIAPWSEISTGTGSQVGAYVSIPRFYYRWSRNGKKLKLQISSKPLNGFFTSPAHANRGDGKGEIYIEPYGERQYVRVGKYLCSNKTYNSVSGDYPYSNVPIGTMRDNIHSLGNNIWLWDFATYWTICMLYLVEYADWDVGKTIGVGGGSLSQARTGQTNSITQFYHTGTTATSRSEAGYVCYRYIEDLWSNYYSFCDGIYFKNEEMYCTKDPAYFGDYDVGTLVGTRIAGQAPYTVSLCISEWSNPSVEGFEYALFPSNGVEDNTFSSYVCDEVNGGYEALNVLYLGSMGNTGGVVRPRDGLFHLDSHYNTSDKYVSVGARLMELY